MSSKAYISVILVFTLSAISLGCSIGKVSDRTRFTLRFERDVWASLASNLLLRSTFLFVEADEPQNTGNFPNLHVCSGGICLGSTIVPACSPHFFFNYHPPRPPLPQFACLHSKTCSYILSRCRPSVRVPLNVFTVYLPSASACHSYNLTSVARLWQTNYSSGPSLELSQPFDTHCPGVFFSRKISAVGNRQCNRIANAIESPMQSNRQCNP